MKNKSWCLALAILSLGGAFLACAGPEKKETCLNDKTKYEQSFVPGDPCFQRSDSLNVENVSGKDKDVSHNFGKNCMQCHQENGPGLGKYVVGGSISKDGKPYAGAKVKFFSDPMRKNLVLELTSDKLGNVYTTKSDKLKMPANGYFVSVTSADGSVVKVMRAPKGSGACNQCHNSSFPITLDKR